MFTCERCGSSYGWRHLGIEDCPRCRQRDEVNAPLSFKAFDLSGLEGRTPKPRKPLGTGRRPATGAQA